MEAQIINDNNLLSIQRNKKSTLLSSSFLLIGIVLMVMALSNIKDTKSSIYFLTIILSITAMVIGVVKIFFGGKERVFTPTKSKVREYSLKYAMRDYATLKTALESGDLRAMQKVELTETSELRMDILISEDNQFATCQIFEWIPYSYEPKSELFTLKPNAIIGLRMCIDKK